MLVKFSTLAGGTFIEVSYTAEIGDTERAFRFDDKGNAEYAYVHELRENPSHARWYGHVLPESQFTFA